jgi:hypothetical protein
MSDKFEQWGIVDLFGHVRVAGMITEQTIGGCSFLRVDIPAMDGNPPFTKLYGNGAIYGITFTDQETATAAARSMSPRPIDVWDAKNLLEAPKLF